MDERDERSVGAGPGSLVDESEAMRLESRQRRGDVVHSKSYMVKARATLLQILRDRGARVCCLQQFQARPRLLRRVAERNEMRADLLRRDIFGRLDFKAQRVAIKRQRLV